ncbi:hypothetical protein [Natronincola ferrireducens]|uniref:Uncharacterized protein n=1 Tax=Natronincola ferrireducens TaxID=393762 RepID=A0A1G9I4M4_9FIRM|nr:hypothetical protein [Natronincola ferrireducens]SDL20198.1 hypothetical protein SAMN05660472_02798 [Natronincola ferrireducens]
MNKLKKILNFADDILFIGGIALISTGVFKIYNPAGYIVLGICCIAFAYLMAGRG